MNGQSKAIIVNTLLPRVTCHQAQLMYLIESSIIVDVSLESLVMSLVCATVGTSLIIADTIELAVMRIVCTIGTLLIAILIVDIPSQALDNISRSLCDKLHTFPLELRRILSNEG